MAGRGRQAFPEGQRTVSRARVAREEAQVGALFTVSSMNLRDYRWERDVSRVRLRSVRGSSRWNRPKLEAEASPNAFAAAW